MRRTATPPRTSVRTSTHYNAHSFPTPQQQSNYSYLQAPSGYVQPQYYTSQQTDPLSFASALDPQPPHYVSHMHHPFPSSPVSHGRLSQMGPGSPIRYPYTSQMPNTASPIHYTSSQTTPSSYLRMQGNASHASTAPQFLERISTEEMEREFEKMAIEIPVDFWIKPKPEDVQGLYSVALEEVFNLKKQEIRMEEMTGEIIQSFPSYESVQLLSYEGRLHLRAIGNLRFLRYCQRLCWHVLGLPYFNRDYLFKPTPNTLLLFCTAFVNFLKFRQMIYSEHSDQFDDMNKKAQEDARLDENIRMLQNDISQFSSMLSQMQPEIKESQEAYDALQLKVQELSNHYNSVKAQLSVIKEAFDTASNKEKDVSLDLARAHMEIDKLKDQVAPSAEKLIQRNKALRKEIEETVDLIQSHEEFIRVSLEKLRLIEKCKKRLTKTEAMLQTQHEPLLQEIGVTRGNLKASRGALSELREEENRVLRQLEVVEGSIRKLGGVYKAKKEEWDKRMNELQRTMKDSTKRLQEREASMRVQSDGLVALNERSQRLMEEILHIRETHLVVVDSLDEKINELLRCRAEFMEAVDRLKRAIYDRSMSPTHASLEKSVFQDVEAKEGPNGFLEGVPMADPEERLKKEVWIDRENENTFPVNGNVLDTRRFSLLSKSAYFNSYK